MRNRDIFFFCSSLLFFAFPSVSGASDPALAKKEGKVVIYGTLEDDTMKRIRDSFERKYGIPTEFFRASATLVIDKSLSESRAGKPLFDVVLAPTASMNLLKQAGIFARYDSPMYADFLQDTADKDGILSPAYRTIAVGLVYNTSYVKPAEAPKSLTDLLDPKWKGRLVMPDPSRHTTTTAWVASLYKILGGREQADRFIRELGRQRPILLESFVPVGERVASGETPLGLTFIRYVYFYEQKGAHLDYVRLGRFLGDGQNIALALKPPHPNAGKLFIDFFLSEESMRIMAAEGEFVNRKGIYPPIKDADKIRFVQMDELGKDEFKKKQAEYHKIFFQ